MTSPQALGEFGEIGSTFFHENEKNLQVGLMSKLMNIRKYTPQISTDDGLGVVGYMII